MTDPYQNAPAGATKRDANRECLRCQGTGDDPALVYIRHCYRCDGSGIDPIDFAALVSPPAGPVVRVQRLHPGARLPMYATNGAAGLDLYAEHGATLPPLSLFRIYVRIAIEIPTGYEGQIRPRSSLSSRGIIVALGTIDSDYRGELAVLLLNLNPTPYHIAAGDRIAQLVIAPVARASIVEVDALTPTARGAGGFGSTGR